MTEDIRKLVTLATISEIIPLDADAITGYRVRGWIVVDSKEKYSVGDTVLYIEPDAFLPFTVPQFEFLEPRGSKKVIHEGKELTGHVLKTIRLRGQYSQGLILPLDFGLTEYSTQEQIDEVFSKLPVFKYEPPLPAGASAVVGAFPSRIQKTDSERVQNLSDEFLSSLNPEEWFATEKLDGTSATFWKLDGALHGAGRNWELSLEKGVHAEIARQLALQELLPEGALIQGEILGEGIQGNPLKLNGRRLAIFYSHARLPEGDTEQFHELIRSHSVPKLELSLPKTVEEALEQVNGLKSTINPAVLAEGVVWWNKFGISFEELGHRPNFKAISNKYLLKHG